MILPRLVLDGFLDHISWGRVMGDAVVVGVRVLIIIVIILPVTVLIIIVVIVKPGVGVFRGRAGGISGIEGGLEGLGQGGDRPFG
jgi:hypothetical protein